MLINRYKESLKKKKDDPIPKKEVKHSKPKKKATKKEGD